MRRQRHGWRARRNSQFEAEAAQPERGAGGDAGDEVEGAADTERDRDRQLLSVLLDPDVLAGMAVGDEERDRLALRPVVAGSAASRRRRASRRMCRRRADRDRDGPVPRPRAPPRRLPRRGRRSATLAARPVHRGGRWRRSRLRVRPGVPRPAAQPRARRHRPAYRDPLLPAPVRRRGGGAPP